MAVLDGVLHIHEADDAERQRQRPGLALELRDGLGAKRMRRQGAGRIAGMDAGLLDMLHDAGDEGVAAVGDAVDVDLDGVGQIAVDQERPLVRHCEFRRPVEGGGETRHVAIELGAVVDDLHGPPAQHIGRPDHDRIADLVGDGAGALRAGRDAAARLADPQAVEQLLEAVAILGEIDGVGRGAEDRHLGVLQRLGELERGLPAELHDDAVQACRWRARSSMISSTSSSVSGSK